MVKYVIVYFTLSIILAAGGSPNASPQELTIASHPFPPWQFYNNRSQQVDGINVEIVEHIFNEMNIKVNFINQPWAMAWKTIKEGKAEAIMSASRKPTREPYLWYPKEDLWISEYVFFYLRSDNSAGLIGSYAEMAKINATIGIVTGYSYHPGFWVAFPYEDGETQYTPDKRNYHRQLYQVPTPNVLFNLLSSNRLDAAINDKSIGLYSINRLGLQDKIVHFDKVLFTKGYPMPFAKNSNYPDLKRVAAQFESELKAIKQNGVYQEIVSRWIH